MLPLTLLPFLTAAAASPAVAAIAAATTADAAVVAAAAALQSPHLAPSLDGCPGTPNPPAMAVCAPTHQQVPIRTLVVNQLLQPGLKEKYLQVGQLGAAGGGRHEAGHICLCRPCGWRT